MDKEYKLKINLFGELWKLSKINLNCNERSKIEIFAKKEEITIAEALLDINLYQENGFEKIDSYKDFKQETISGLIDNFKNQIEIWFANKKIGKYKIADLNNDLLIFPLYHIQKSEFNFKGLGKGIYIEQREIGLIATYEVFITNFEIDKLSYELIDVIKSNSWFRLLNKINYEGVLLKKRNKTDSLITSQFSFEIF